MQTKHKITFILQKNENYSLDIDNNNSYIYQCRRVFHLQFSVCALNILTGLNVFRICMCVCKYIWYSARKTLLLTSKSSCINYNMYICETLKRCLSSWCKQIYSGTYLQQMLGEHLNLNVNLYLNTNTAFLKIIVHGFNTLFS